MSSASAPVRARGLVGRRYRGIEDLAPMQALLRVGRRLADVTTSWNPGDLEWWIASEDPAIDWSERITLWSLADAPERIIAWTWWTPPAELDWFVDPTLDTRDLRAGIMDALERPLSTIWATAGHEALVAQLRGLGYERSGDGFLDMTRGLDADDDPPLRLPVGFTVRPAELPADLDERVRVHRAAFAPSKMTVEKHLRVAQMPSYRPDLDLVCVAPGGTFASYCIAWFDQETGTVEFEPVGTDPQFQRRGLASAVMTEAMRRAAQLGAGVALVTSHGGEKGVGGAALYRSLGFRQVREFVPCKRLAQA
jgi:ribosomal protein S18 acetylase RimI-like enzyme